MRYASFVLFIIISIVAVPTITAHVPLTAGDNESLETAAIITDPTKSWALYSELHHSGEARYYLLNMEEGQTLYASLFVPPKYYEEGFTPGLIIMGPGITSHGEVPSFVEVPPEADVMVVENRYPRYPTYEPFTPSSLYSLAEARLTITTPGTYYLVVYDPSNEGHFGLAVGYREEFTLQEWILVPINVLGIHQWEGQSLFVILAPLLAIMSIGFVFLVVRRVSRGGSPQSAFGWVAAFAGLLFLGSSAILFTQMIVALQETSLVSEMIVTLIFIISPAVLGIVSLRMALKDHQEVVTRQRIIIAIIGVISLFVWAGLLVGSILAILASIVPGRFLSTS
ncbi:MAG: hypothetical protein ACFFC7_34410 [Candidatus Hermodarchaeota archaeon]